MANIYFAGSIRAGHNDVKVYAQLIGHLKKYGTVLTEHVGMPLEKILSDDASIGNAGIYERDMRLLDNADAVVAEVSTPSMGVGYEIGRAESLHKPILCLCRKQNEKTLSAMIAGNAIIRTAFYQTIDDAKSSIDDFFNERA